jgi:hypothetical protein
MASAEIGNDQDTQDGVRGELIESDSFGEPCEPLTRIAVTAVFKNTLTRRIERDLSLHFGIVPNGINPSLPSTSPALALMLTALEPHFSKLL